MGFLDSFLVLGVFLVGLPVAGVIGWALQKMTGSRLLGRLPVVLVLLASLFGVPLSLRFAGAPAMARVVERGERVDLARRDGAWTTSQWLRVRFRPANARRYQSRMEELAGVPNDIVSTGPYRAQTIVLRHPYD